MTMMYDPMYDSPDSGHEDVAVPKDWELYRFSNLTNSYSSGVSTVFEMLFGVCLE